MSTRGQTPSQTVGPYFSMRLATSDRDAEMATPDTPGQLIVVAGQVTDGNRDPIEDALIEVWQADARGRYRHPFDDDRPAAADEGFTGFGRAKSRHEDGTWSVRTIKPGRVPSVDGEGLQAPHLNLCLQARGMLMPCFTRVYFSDEADANATDTVLAATPADRRATLIGVLDPTEGGAHTYRFDIRVQGQNETVFLDF